MKEVWKVTEFCFKLKVWNYNYKTKRFYLKKASLDASKLAFFKHKSKNTCAIEKHDKKYIIIKIKFAAILKNGGSK